MNIEATLHRPTGYLFYMCVKLLIAYAYNLYNKPQAATEFGAKLDVCRIQYCSNSQVLSFGDVGFSVSSSSSLYVISKL